MGQLLQETAAFPNLLRAWDCLKGRLPDSVRLSFAWRLEDHLLDLSDGLAAGAYSPRPAPVGYHSTDSGKKIPVPCLEDRLVLRALKQVLLPHLERSFIHDTYAGLPGRGVHRAVTRVMAFQRRVSPPDRPRAGWILKADVQNFYPSLRHDVLLAHCRRRLQDEALVDLLSRFLGVWGQWSGTPHIEEVEGVWRKELVQRRSSRSAATYRDQAGCPETRSLGFDTLRTQPALALPSFGCARSGTPGAGIPLGSSPSALLSNLYLDPFDHFVKDELGFKFYVRYSDDMAFLSADRGDLEGLLVEAAGLPGRAAGPGPQREEDVFQAHRRRPGLSGLSHFLSPSAAAPQEYEKGAEAVGQDGPLVRPGKVGPGGCKEEPGRLAGLRPLCRHLQLSAAAVRRFLAEEGFSSGAGGATARRQWAAAARRLSSTATRSGIWPRIT